MNKNRPQDSLSTKRSVVRISMVKFIFSFQNLSHTLVNLKIVKVDRKCLISLANFDERLTAKKIIEIFLNNLKKLFTWNLNFKSFAKMAEKKSFVSVCIFWLITSWKFEISKLQRKYEIYHRIVISFLAIQHWGQWSDD